MPYKDPEKRAAVKRESNRRWRERKLAEDPEGYRAYMYAAQKKHRESRTPEQKAEISRKQREWAIRTGRLDPNSPPRLPRPAGRRNPDFLTDFTDPRHGTLNGYNNLHCRCQGCTEAHARYQAAYMARRRAKQSQAE